MIFSTNTILTSATKKVFKEECVNLKDKSFFYESLDLLSKENNNFRLLLNEGFGKFIFAELVRRMDPAKIIIGILNGFVKIIDKLWNNFHALLLNFLGTNNVIKAYKKQLETRDIEINFKEDRFIYTYLGLDNSYTSFDNELNKELTTLTRDLESISSYKSLEELINEIDRINSDIDNSEDFYSEVRGRVLNKNYFITKSEFASELYKFYRNDGNQIGPSIIKSEEIRKCVDNYFNYSKNIKAISKNKTDLEKSAKKIQNKIMNTKFTDYAKESLPDQAKDVFMNILKTKAGRVKELCEIYTLVFSAKLDAVKESYSQTAKILFLACQQIAKEGK